MRVPTPVNVDPRAPDLREQIALLPAGSGIYALHAEGQRPHISWSVNLARRLLRLLVSSYTPSTSLIGKLRDSLHKVECWPTGSKLEASLVMYQLTKTYFPEDYIFRLRLRMPWFVGMTHADPFPRLVLTNRVPRKCNLLFGPFRNRDLAQQYQDEVLGLFQIRRCTDALAPAPNHPGCIYGEMNQCLRPCQCAVTVEEYGSEVRRVTDFLASNGRGAIAVLSAARARATEQTNFEQAAQIHKRIEKMSAAANARDGVIADIRCFNGIALTRGAGVRQFRLWPMFEGFWQEPLALDFSNESSGGARSLDHELRERLNESLNTRTADRRRAEDLAIFSRWYYSSWRDGQWFPFRTLAEFNYHRLVRAISKLAKNDVANAAP